MSRQGVEAKLPWNQVPLAVRREVEAAAGARVIRGARIWGGYGPAPTFRLRLTDGRGIFFKGIHAESNEFSRQALERERRVYQELGALISPWAPQFYGAIALDDWRALLLEDLGPKSAPPWTPALARAAMRGFADFHASTIGCDLPNWLPAFASSHPSLSWEQVEEETEGFRLVAAMADASAEDARAWLCLVAPALARAARVAWDMPGPHALLHTDTRSDNLRIVQGRLRLFDWPSVEVGFPEFDVAEFAQSIEVDGGPESEQIARWYGERLAVRAEALDAAIAWMAAYFAMFSWQPEIPGLPRLRRFQRQQLSVTLRWAARRLALPAPAWTAALD
jgi:hypothetical protein